MTQALTAANTNNAAVNVAGVHPNFTAHSAALKHPTYQVAEGEKTPGEKMYDFHNYITVGYAINLALSVAITEFFKEGAGKPILKNVENVLSDQMIKFMNPQSAKNVSETTAKYFLLTSGGTMLMAPVLWAENNKSKLVYLLNRKYAPQTIATDDPYKDVSAGQILSKNFDEDCLAQPLHEQPKHGLINGLWRRSLSVATVVAWGNLVNKVAGEEFFENKGLEAIKKAESLPGMKAVNRSIENNAKINRWTRWTISDIVNTAITTSVIWLTNGVKKGGAEEHPNELEAPSPADCLPNSHFKEAIPSHISQPESFVTNPEITHNHAAHHEKAPEELVAHASHKDAVEHQRRHEANLTLAS